MILDNIPRPLQVVAAVAFTLSLLSACVALGIVLALVTGGAT